MIFLIILEFDLECPVRILHFSFFIGDEELEEKKSTKSTLNIGTHPSLPKLMISAMKNATFFFQKFGSCYLFLFWYFLFFVFSCGFLHCKCFCIAAKIVGNTLKQYKKLVVTFYCSVCLERLGTVLSEIVYICIPVCLILMIEFGATNYIIKE